MSYCPYCGREVSSDMSFCPGCGAAISNEVKSYTVSESITSNTGDYKIYITGIGSASKTEVSDLLQDVLGYTEISANNLIRNIPVQIAGNLSLKQAAIVAQAFEEYGVELAVTNNDEYEDISRHTSSSSLFNSDGSFLSSAAIVLATIGATNRLRSIVKPRRPSLLQMIFHSLFTTRRRPPVHVRRVIRPRNMTFQMQQHRPHPTVRQQLYPFGQIFNNKKPSSFGTNSNKPSGFGTHSNKPSQNKPSGFGSHSSARPGGPSHSSKPSGSHGQRHTGFKGK